MSANEVRVRNLNQWCDDSARDYNKAKTAIIETNMPVRPFQLTGLPAAEVAFKLLGEVPPQSCILRKKVCWSVVGAQLASDPP